MREICVSLCRIKCDSHQSYLCSDFFLGSSTFAPNRFGEGETRLLGRISQEVIKFKFILTLCAVSHTHTLFHYRLRNQLILPQFHADKTTLFRLRTNMYGTFSVIKTLREQIKSVRLDGINAFSPFLLLISAAWKRLKRQKKPHWKYTGKRMSACTLVVFGKNDIFFFVRLTRDRTMKLYRQYSTQNEQN